jgi:hypothetical protein
VALMMNQSEKLRQANMIRNKKFLDTLDQSNSPMRTETEDNNEREKLAKVADTVYRCVCHGLDKCSSSITVLRRCLYTICRSLNHHHHHHHIVIPVTTPLMVKALLLMRKPACGERVSERAREREQERARARERDREREKEREHHEHGITRVVEDLERGEGAKSVEAMLQHQPGAEEDRRRGKGRGEGDTVCLFPLPRDTLKIKHSTHTDLKINTPHTQTFADRL